MQKKPKNWWGFETKDIDKNVRPQDDFYQYANGGWLNKNKIPADESRWGSFITLRYNTEQQLKALVEGTRDSQVRAMYRSAMDMGRRNKLGLTPLMPLLDEVRAIATTEDLLRVLAHLDTMGIAGLWNSFIDQDAKNSSRYMLHLWQGGLGMPERDYYLLDAPEQKRVRGEYMAHIERLLRLAGYSAAKARAAREVVMRIETSLAHAHMRKEDTRDSDKTYHKLSLGALQKTAPTVNWAQYFARTGAKNLREIIAGQPEFLAAASTVIAQTPLEDIKTYLEWHVINDTANLLSDKFVKEQFRYYGAALIGQKKIKPLWRRALGATNGALGERVGKLYVQQHFPPAAKRAMDALVSDLFDVYEKRIKALDWMSPGTKKKAVRKLRAVSRKIGYPKKWKSYKGLALFADDYFGNTLRSSAFEHKRQMKKLRGPVDRHEWHMSPQTVNAYCNFGLNEIVFPAAILQWPFFDLDADAAINYAGIGAVIGHEMTHAFDDQGAKFDLKGNMKGWWQPGDLARFTKKGQLLRAQYDEYEVAPGVKVNGQLTLGENIADLGGLAIAWDAYQTYLAKHGRKSIDGLSPEQRFFLGFAQMERELRRPEAEKMLVLTDPHSPSQFRINGPLANFEPFYTMYGLKPGDKLYRPSSKHAKIW